MCDHINEFAKKYGFDHAEKLGEYDGQEVYFPRFADTRPRLLGFPQYILLKDGALTLHIDRDFKITDHFFPRKE